ncbi:hypothetical protein [Nonomuraea sp. NPDC050786]|uniref:hypothetical protein n=1 Tax=Nonomuraea sp. NPDC050786 TaxID=3154840 RepID=UPI003407D486
MLVLTRLRLAFFVAPVLMVPGCTVTPPAPAPAEVSTVPQPSQETADDDDDDEGYIEICVVKKTRIRVNYRGCDDAQSGLTWYFFPLDARIPATGSRAKRGSFKQPPGDSYRAPAKGGIGSKVMLTDVDARVEICVVKRTRIRVSDIRCDDGEKNHSWYYIRIDGHVPPVGGKGEDGSFRKPYGETYRARRSGGDAAKAAVDYEDPDAPEAEEEEEEYCTTTINGECVATNRCTETVNSVCTKTEDDTLGDVTRKCTNVYRNKRWTRRCSR